MANNHESSETGEENSVMKINNTRKETVSGISALPDEILSSIISFLRIRETVCASVLSVRWRNLCASKSNLRFERRDMFKTPTNSECCKGLKDEYVERVDKFLKFYRGSKIVSFLMSACLGRKYAHNLDQWIGFSVSRGVEKLGIKLVCGEIRSNIIENRHELYVFPCQLLSRGDTSKLRDLYLRACILGIDLSNKLSSLKVLTLVFVPLESRDLQNIFSCCPNLAFLKFEKCSLPKKLSVCGSLPRFKCLKVLYCSGAKKIELIAPSLMYFEYAIDAIEKVKLSFTEVSNLERVYIRVHGGRVNYVFNVLARQLRQLNALSVHTSSCSVQRLHKRITTFSKVKQLRLYFSGAMEFDITRVTKILSAFPILQIFHLAVNSPSNEQRREHTDFEECDHDQLKEVEIGGFTGTQNMMSFAIYLLKHAVALEQMIINPQVMLYDGGDVWTVGKRISWDIRERELMRKQLQENISNNVVLTIL